METRKSRQKESVWVVHGFSGLPEISLHDVQGFSTLPEIPLHDVQGFSRLPEISLHGVHGFSGLPKNTLRVVHGFSRVSGNSLHDVRPRFGDPKIRCTTFALRPGSPGARCTACMTLPGFPKTCCTTCKGFFPACPKAVRPTSKLTPVRRPSPSLVLPRRRATRCRARRRCEPSGGSASWPGGRRCNQAGDRSQSRRR